MHTELGTGNCVVTLTYNDENLPEDKSVSKKHLQTFIKRLRYYLGEQDIKFKYYACGEYGDRSKRAHYHVIIFGHDFIQDRYLYKTSAKGNYLYRSPTLEKAWTQGYSDLGEFSWQHAAYVARYVMKKRKGKVTEENSDYYLYYDEEEHLDKFTGELKWHTHLKPEFVLMSRGQKPEDPDNPTIWESGIGKTWFKKYWKDCLKGYLTVDRGAKVSIPKYYMDLMEKEHPKEFIQLKKLRRQKALEKQEKLDRKMDLREQSDIRRSSEIILEQKLNQLTPREEI